MSIMKDTLNELFRAKSSMEAKYALNNSGSDYSALLLHIFDQIPKQFRTVEEISNAYSLVADADLTLRRIYQNQNWTILRNFFNFLGPGIFYARQKSKYNKITKLNNLPSSFIMMGISKRVRGNASKMAEEIAPKLHISRSIFIKKDFNLVSKILLGYNGSEVAAWLNLSDEIIDLLQKINPNSELADTIEEARIKVGTTRFGNSIIKEDRKFEIDSYLLDSNENKTPLKETKEDDASLLEDTNEDVQKSLDDFF